MESEHCPLGNSPCAPKGETVLGLDLKPKGPVSVLQCGGFFTQVFENIERVKESSPGLSWEISYKFSFDSWASAEESPLSTWMLGFYDPGARCSAGTSDPLAVWFCSPHPLPLSVLIVQCPRTTLVNPLHLTSICWHPLCRAFCQLLSTQVQQDNGSSLSHCHT